MSMPREALEQLRQVYLLWGNEISETMPEFLEEKYLNPYYIGIPERWFESDCRILIVGQEGHGEWGCGKEDG